MDFDEAGFTLEACDGKYGYGHKTIRVRKLGHYTRGRKLTVLFGCEPGDPALPPHVDGSVQNPRRWFKILTVLGTSSYVFSDFLDEVCTEIEDNPALGDVDVERVVLFDNLRSHLTPLVYNTVEHRGGDIRFEIVRRPPYQPKFGPTEYVFCQVAMRLQRLVQPNWTLEDLRQNLNTVFANVGCDGGFDRIFQHCGY